MIMTIITISLLVSGAYLIGSIPTAVWIGRIFYKVDVREHGSGNAGATNTIRVLGWKAGVPVMLFDVIKGWLAVKLAVFAPESLFTDQTIDYLRIGMGVAAVLGHVFPVYIGFRGGKGVATLLGVGIALYPISIWIVVGIFFLVLFSSRYVSLSSMTAAVSFPLVDFFLLHQTQPGLIILSVLVAVFVPLTHRKNIQRLLRGEESKFWQSWKRRK